MYTKVEEIVNDVIVEEGKTIEMDGVKVADALSLSKLQVGVA